MTLRALRFCFALIVLTPMCGCAGYESRYSAKSIEAWAVDADTNEPIEGVVVVASWEIEAGEMTARSKLIRLKILESVTDKTGRLNFAAWGPEANPSDVGYLGSRDPRLVLFKGGYGYVGLENFNTEPRPGALRYSDWHGKTIRMHKAGSDNIYLESFGSLNRLLDRMLADPEEPCNWNRAPLMVAAVMKEERRLREMGLRSISSLISGLRSNEMYFAKNGCGSVNGFLEGLEK